MEKKKQYKKKMLENINNEQNSQSSFAEERKRDSGDLQSERSNKSARHS
jgi:hypothetical protein